LPLSNEERARLVDKFGRIDGRKTEIARRGFLCVPIVNVYEELLLRLLLEFSDREGMPLVRKWLYPRNYDAALCVTHDVEYVISAEAYMDAVNSFRKGKLLNGFVKGFLASIAAVSTLLADLRVFPSRQSLRFIPLFLSRKLMRFNPVWNFNKFINIEKEFGVVSSFYFLANESQRDSDYEFRHPLILQAINLVRDNGCEVGLHASFNSYNDEERLRKEKRELEKVLRAKVGGIRQHYYNFEVPRTWRCQEDAGFLYDSTFGYAQQVGFRAGACLPFKPFDSQGKKAFSILEVPLIIEDGVLLQEKYLGLSFRKAFDVCKNLVEVILRHHGVLTLNWHESVDRERTQHWFVLYKQILQYCSEFNFWRTTAQNLARWFEIRRAIMFQRGSNFKDSLTMGIDSPFVVQDFVLRVHPPSQRQIRKIVFNQEPINYTKNKTNKMLSVCVNLQKGKNRLKILFASRNAKNS